ncbi:MAG: tRNA (guanine46-N7-)-methyltransferase [Herminiimonas sp.]|nr:tRNA (guanine46-N7-)-methyltransferase [Herminiimonas sp.]
MHANSNPIHSNQTGIHDQLAVQVARHASTQFLKPITAYNRAAFDTSLAAWKASGHQSLIIDSGCGVGLSTLHLATRFPNHFVIGIDQSQDRLARRTNWQGAVPSNCTRVRADLVDYWRLMQQEGITPDRHYLLYPNPWPKKRHLARRWHGHPVFPTVVALGGHFECRSNWRIYIEECAAALAQLTGADVAVEPYYPHDQPRGLAQQGASAPITPFEQKYLASGHGLWRCRSALLPLSERPAGPN